MPCHPDRVRRNYHDINIVQGHSPIDQDVMLSIRVTRHDIATAMTSRELRDVVLRCVAKGIEDGYRR